MTDERRHDDRPGQRGGAWPRLFAAVSTLAVFAAVLADGSTGFPVVKEGLGTIPAMNRHFEGRVLDGVDVYMTYDQIRAILDEEPYVQKTGRHRIYQFDRDLDVIQVVEDADGRVLSLGVYTKDPEYAPAVSDWSYLGDPLARFVADAGDQPDDTITGCGAKSAAYVMLYRFDDAARNFQSVAIGVSGGVPGSAIDEGAPCRIDDDPSCGGAGTACLPEERFLAETRASMMVVTRPDQPIIPEMLCPPDQVRRGTCAESAKAGTS